MNIHKGCNGLAVRRHGDRFVCQRCLKKFHFTDEIKLIDQGFEFYIGSPYPIIVDFELTPRESVYDELRQWYSQVYEQETDHFHKVHSDEISS